MNPGTASFVIWSVTMVLMIAGLFWLARRSRRVEKEMETAVESLPEIRRAAEDKYKKRFGRAPTESDWDHNLGKKSVRQA